jgi:hypothetical protein
MPVTRKFHKHTKPACLLIFIVDGSMYRVDAVANSSSLPAVVQINRAGQAPSNDVLRWNSTTHAHTHARRLDNMIPAGPRSRLEWSRSIWEQD